MLTEPMLAFVARVNEVLAATDDPVERARGTAAVLPDLLAAENALHPDHLAADPAGYRQHVVHVDPLGRFSVVSLVWLPGQRTPVHNHVCWCVVGVLAGQEEEVVFHYDADRDVLVPLVTGHNSAGQVCWLVPPEQDIHQVGNAGTELAVSIHVYGADIAKLGSSINRTYAAPIVPATAGSTQASTAAASTGR